jgi:hypothetical protein
MFGFSHPGFLDRLLNSFQAEVFFQIHGLKSGGCRATELVASRLLKFLVAGFGVLLSTPPLFLVVRQQARLPELW